MFTQLHRVKQRYTEQPPPFPPYNAHEILRREVPSCKALRFTRILNKQTKIIVNNQGQYIAVSLSLRKRLLEILEEGKFKQIGNKNFARRNKKAGAILGK